MAGEGARERLVPAARARELGSAVVIGAGEAAGGFLFAAVVKGSEIFLLDDAISTDNGVVILEVELKFTDLVKVIWWDSKVSVGFFYSSTRLITVSHNSKVLV